MNYEEEIKRLNEKIEFLSRTNMLYSDWEHRDTQVTSDLIRKGIEEHKINAELRAEIAELRAEIAAEREACAKVCEDSYEYAGDTLAKAIRARGEQK